MTEVVIGSVVERLGVRLSGPADGPDPRVLLGLALRDNPRRAQLLVSRVLGKHIPTDPRLVRAAGLLLGGLVADAVAGRPPRALPVALLHAAVRGEPGAAAALLSGITVSPTDAVVLGFAETATALGHSVAEALGGADYLHSTRRPVPGFGAAGAFTEEHSHHTEHLLLPSDPGVIAGSRPLVLVDDELSTGRTVVNTIAALHRVAPRRHYVVAALVDLREHPLTGLPDGVRVDVVSLTRAALSLPDDLAERATALRAELQTPRGRTRAAPAAPSEPTGRAAPPHTEPVARSDRTGRAAPPPVEPPASSDRTGCATPLHAGVGAGAGRTGAGAERPPADGRAARVALTDLGWPADLPAGGRHGFTPAHHRALAAILPEIAAGLARTADVRADERTLVLGTEELMALPLHLAAALAARQNTMSAGVWFSTTTRSPAFVVDEPDYALTSGITFPAHDDPADGPGPRHAYNVAQGWDQVLVVVDPPAETPALHTGLLTALAPHTRRVTVVVTS